MGAALLVLVAGCVTGCAPPEPPPEPVAPVVEVEPAPAPTQPARQALVVHATGDVNLDPGYIPALRGRYEYAWTGLGGLFTDDDLASMAGLRQAFNPTNRLSPDKLLPTSAGCGIEQKAPKRRAAV